ncbi:hypothetical protein BC826DRAFT_967438 [Russula brevipes]|nr:hypothetical protein BC826DRAFT_967438 [Russula brevipes]
MRLYAVCQDFPSKVARWQFRHVKLPATPPCLWHDNGRTFHPPGTGIANLNDLWNRTFLTSDLRWTWTWKKKVGHAKSNTMHKGRLKWDATGCDMLEYTGAHTPRESTPVYLGRADPGWERGDHRGHRKARFGELSEPNAVRGNPTEYIAESLASPKAPTPVFTSTVTGQTAKRTTRELTGIAADAGSSDTASGRCHSRVQ